MPPEKTLPEANELEEVILEIVILGLNHNTAAVDLREQLISLLRREGETQTFFKGVPGLDEIFFLTTCNRVELLFTSEDPENAVRDLTDRWAAGLEEPLSQFLPKIYVFRGDEAVRHLFRVASSLDSMILGEPQILGQIKEAYRESVRNRNTGVILNRLLHKSFSVAKRVRTETGIAGHAVSVSFAAVELAKKIFRDLNDKKVLLIGAGEMAELAAEHFFNNHVRNITVINRTRERAEELAGRWQGQSLPWAELSAALFETDIVVSSTGAQEMLIDAAQVRQIMRKRKQRPLFFIDIAVPRDIDPRINEMDNVFLYDIDDLQGIVTQNLAERKQEARLAEGIVAEEGLKFRTWLKGLEVVPTIVALRKKFDELREGEWKKNSSLLDGMTDEQQKGVEMMMEALVNKILHDPISFLKDFGHEEHKDQKINSLQKIFKLDLGEGKVSEDTNAEPKA
ncbi:MAG: glutamyl-tRNA reductase [Thermodesulfobacteriota bacterium]